jgi:hypothetical protein
MQQDTEIEFSALFSFSQSLCVLFSVQACKRGFSVFVSTQQHTDSFHMRKIQWFFILRVNLQMQLNLNVTSHISHFAYVTSEFSRFSITSLLYVFVYLSRDSSVGITMGYGLDSRDTIPAKGKRFFSSPHRPNQLWSTPSLLSNGYRGPFVCGKAARA